MRPIIRPQNSEQLFALRILIICVDVLIVFKNNLRKGENNQHLPAERSRSYRETPRSCPAVQPRLLPQKRKRNFMNSWNYSFDWNKKFLMMNNEEIP